MHLNINDCTLLAHELVREFKRKEVVLKHLSKLI